MVNDGQPWFIMDYYSTNDVVFNWSTSTMASISCPTDGDSDGYSSTEGDTTMAENDPTGGG